MTLVFVGPAIAAFVILKYIPIFQAFFYSFFKYSLVDPPGKFVGLRNYINVLSSPLFWKEFWNTSVLFGFSMLMGFWVPIVQALLLSQIRKGKNLLRFLYILPAGLPSIAGLVLWKFIWNPDGGLANVVTHALGLGRFNWLGDPKLVKFCLRFPGLFGGGLGILIYLVAINNVSMEQYEAAIIDGANAFKRMLHITLPNIWYIIQIQFVLALTSSLLPFDDVYVLTQGGPNYSSATLVIGLYEKAFREWNIGQSMAMSVIIFIITLFFMLLRLKKMKSNNV